MSTSWDIHCRTCDESYGIEDNRDKDLLTALIQSARPLAMVASMIDKMEPDAKNGISMEMEYGFRLRPEWFLTHAGHDLAVRNGYGEFLDECSKRFDCGHCGTRLICRLNQRHEGRCSTARIAAAPKP